MQLLNTIETRILGSLMEKEAATPDYYPLTINSLMNACNQKSSRDPVMGLDIQDLNSGLSSLMSKGYVKRIVGDGTVPKFRHTLLEVFSFSQRQLAVLCVLFLRGPQTSGEIKGRTGRLCHFNTMDEVYKALDHLKDRQDGPFVKTLSRRPGQKEARIMHLFGGDKGNGEDQPQEIKQTVLVKTHTQDDKLEKTIQELKELKELVEGLDKRIGLLEKELM